MPSLIQIQQLIPGSKIANCENPNSLLIERVSTLHQDFPNSLTYVSDKSYIKTALKSNASAFLIQPDWIDQFDKPVILVNHIELALIEVLKHLHPEKQPSGQISKWVEIHPSATVGANSDIGSFVTIGSGSKIGKNSIIGNGVKIGDNVIIGDEARIGANCVFFDGVRIGNRFVSFGNCTIGGDGFRFVEVSQKQIKIPQVGTVVIGEDVEIGSNTCIDRGGIDNTVIGDGTKMDNDVQIAHNVKIGKNVIVAGATAIAGSAVIGDNCKISGACAIGDHIILPPGTMVAGGSGVRNSPEKADVFAGWDWNLTFREFQKFRANVKHILSLNMLVKRVADLESKAGIAKTGE